ncbi:MAG: hypothetical protein VW498_06445 [Candidatus Thalassarchaeaceae archaeon]
MELKKVMNPKWWLIVLGALGILLGSGNYIDAENAAETGWGDDATEHDVFYEQAWGLMTLGVGITALATGLLVTGKPLAQMAMAGSGAQLLTFALLYTAGADVDYGFSTPEMMGPPMIILLLLGVAGYLHKDGE